MSAPRRIVPGFYFLTRRTTQRMFLLRPDKETKQIFEFCLALAAHKFGMGVLAWQVMSNHYHLVIYDPKAQVPAFAQYLNRLLAAVFNDRWQRRESFWSSDPPCITFLVTEEDVMEKIAYTLGNPVVALLVDSVAEWPGSSSLEYLDGKTRTITRPEFYFSDESVVAETVELTLSAPRKETSFKAWAKRVMQKVAKVDARAAERRKSNPKKYRSLGVRAVLAKRPTDRPTKKAPPTKLRPHVACGDREKRVGSLEQVKEFRWQYREARARFAKGDHGVVFPKGTYRMRRIARVVIGKCERAPADYLRKHLTRIPHEALEGLAS